MPVFPGTLIPWVQQTFVDANGDPLDSGYVVFKVAGLNTDKDTFTAADLQVANQNPLPLDSDGRPSGGSGSIFFEPGAYDVFVYDSADNLIYTIAGVEDVGATFLATWGQTLAEGEKDAPDDYVITADDITVTALPVASGIYYLPQVTSRTFPLTLVNLSTTVDVLLTPNGSDTINGQSGALTIPAGTSPKFSGVTLVPDIDNSNWIFQSYWES